MAGKLGNTRSFFCSLIKLGRVRIKTNSLSQLRGLKGPSYVCCLLMCAGFWSFDLKRIKKIKALMKYERPKLRRYAQKRSLFLMKTEFLAEISFHFWLLYFVRALDRHFSPLQLYCEWTQICFYSHMFRLNYPLGIAWPQKCQMKTSLAWYEASFGKSAGTIASVEAQFAKWSDQLCLLHLQGPECHKDWRLWQFALYEILIQCALVTYR